MSRREDNIEAGQKRKANDGLSSIPKKANAKEQSTSLLSNYDTKISNTTPPVPVGTKTSSKPRGGGGSSREGAKKQSRSPMGFDLSQMDPGPVNSRQPVVLKSSSNNGRQPQKDQSSKTTTSHNVLWNSLSELCSEFADSQDQSFQLKEKSSGSSGGLIDLSGSMLERRRYDWFDLDENGNIAMQPKIPIFPEEFPPGKKEWPLSWWGIVDPELLGVTKNGKEVKSPRQKDKEPPSSNHRSRSEDRYRNNGPPRDNYDYRAEDRYLNGPPPPSRRDGYDQRSEERFRNGPRDDYDRYGRQPSPWDRGGPPPPEYRGAAPPDYRGPRERGPHPDDRFADERRRWPDDRGPPPRFRDDRPPPRYPDDRDLPPRRDRGPERQFDDRRYPDDRNLPPRRMDVRGPTRPPRYQDMPHEERGPPRNPDDRHHPNSRARNYDDRGRGSDRGRDDQGRHERGRHDRKSKKRSRRR